MILNVKRNLLLFLNVVLIVACSNQNWEVKKAKTPKLEPIHTQKTDANDSLVAQVGYQLEESLYDSKVDFFLNKFNLDRFGQLSTYSEYEDGQLKKFKKGFIEGFSKGITSLPEKIISTIDTGGFYDFLDYYYDADAKTYRMLFRLFSEEDGINYHDFELVLIDGQFYIQDIYIYLTGENLSETANMIYLMSMPKNLFEKIISKNNSKDMNYLVKAVSSQRTLQNETALTYLNRIEGELKHTKIYHVMKILATSDLDESLYMNAMIDMQKDYKDDPTCHLLSIDYYFMNEEYDKAILNIDQLEEETGDSFLNYHRGNIAFAAERYNDATSYYEKLVEDFPTYDTPRFSLISCYLEMDNYKKCIATLDLILANDLYLVSDLIEFVESEEEDGTNPLLLLAQSKDYKDWKNRQTNR